MPRSAIMTGAVDLVLPVAKIPEALVKFDRRMAARPTHADAADRARTAHGLAARDHRSSAHEDRARFHALQAGHAAAPDRAAHGDGGDRDRRHAIAISKCCAATQASSTCLPRTCSSTSPASSAIRRCSISWRTKIVPDLVRSQSSDQPIRIWIAGCSTGEETYSLAMLFREQIAAAKRNIKLQVFASDVDPDAVASAREGLYPETIEADVSPARLARFFSKEDHGYRVSPELRAAVVFTVQDVLADPPFSRLDLVSCRNLLIYLGPEAQAKVISLFHFALREGGILLLGSSETVGNADGRFEVISKSERLYRHVGRSRPGEFGFLRGAGDGVRVARAPGTRPGAVAPGRARRPLPAAGDGDLCAGGGADQPQARVPLFPGTDRPLSARGAGASHARSARHGAPGHAHQAAVGDPAGQPGECARCRRRRPRRATTATRCRSASTCSRFRARARSCC